MAVPTAEIVLRGFPPDAGFTHPDGGVMGRPDSGVVIPDAGPTVDAGCLDGCTEEDGGMAGGAGGGNGSAGGTGGDPGTAGGSAAAGGGEVPMDVPPCGCASAPGLLVLAGLMLAMLRRRKP
jgi:uncharacterized protein (TIGR03382 family)